ncbi:MAG: phospholipase [Actinobacteria bacterium]|nr:MAG: phospholipase [Actinomycetota bacterium]
MLIDRIDRVLGRATERAIRAHHLRRLRRVDWEQALDPPDKGRWCAGEPQPRSRCSLEILIDGETALPAMAEAIKAAKSHVHITGWFASPDFELERDCEAKPLRDVLAEAAERIPVRILLWAGSPAPPPPAGEHTLQLIRTVPQGIYNRLPRGDYRILEAYLRALRAARRLIYIENQFLWSPEVIEVLSDKLVRPPSKGFRLLVLLPVRANNGADVTRGQAGELANMDDGAGRFLACSIYAQDDSGDPTPVYVHAKICIVDDEWLTLGSANLNERSLFNDSEVNIVCNDVALATATRERLWAEHLEMPLDEVHERDPTDLIDNVWCPIAVEQLRRRENQQPLTHRLVRLPAVSRHSRRLLGPLESFFVDG